MDNGAITIALNSCHSAGQFIDPSVGWRNIDGWMRGRAYCRGTGWVGGRELCGVDGWAGSRGDCRDV